MGGIVLIALESGTGARGFIGPLPMTLLLVKLSGATLLQKNIAVHRTSGFIPRPPRAG